MKNVVLGTASEDGIAASQLVSQPASQSVCRPAGQPASVCSSERCVPEVQLRTDGLSHGAAPYQHSALNNPVMCIVVYNLLCNITCLPFILIHLLIPHVSFLVSPPPFQQNLNLRKRLSEIDKEKVTVVMVVCVRKQEDV